MTAPETSALGWPDPARPGLPQNPERKGWHWLASGTDPEREPFPMCWFPPHEDKRGWWSGYTGAGADAASGCRYLGPAVPDATAQADAAGALEERDALRRIVNIAWELACEGADYDGGSIQVDCVRAGLATVRDMTPEECEAHGCGSGDWYEPTPLGRRAMGWPATAAPDPDVSGRAG